MFAVGIRFFEFSRQLFCKSETMLVLNINPGSRKEFSIISH